MHRRSALSELRERVAAALADETALASHERALWRAEGRLAAIAMLHRAARLGSLQRIRTKV